jgi:hypothetical protein
VSKDVMNVADTLPPASVLPVQVLPVHGVDGPDQVAAAQRQHPADVVGPWQ